MTSPPFRGCSADVLCASLCGNGLANPSLRRQRAVGCAISARAGSGGAEAEAGPPNSGSFAPVMHYTLLILAKAVVAVPTLEPSVLSGPTGPTVTIAPGVDMP